MGRMRLPETEISQRILAKNAGEIDDWTWTFYDIQKMHDAGWLGQGQRIAILDSGLNNTHPDLMGTVVHAEDMRDFDPKRYDKYKPKFGEGKLNVDESHNVVDRNYHSTWIHGRFSAVHNGVGVRGISPKAEIVILKVYDDDGSGDVNWGINATYRAWELGCRIMNFSGGLDQKIKKYEEAIKYIAERGGFYFAAGGNDGKNNDIDFPGNSIYSFANGSHDKNGRLSWFSDSGKEADFYGAGDDVLSTYGQADYALQGGSSMSTPTNAAIFTNALTPVEQLLGVTITMNNARLLTKNIRDVRR